ncbi:MAG: hypothetical protein WBM13_13310 [Bacteroidia bacterium]
MRTLTKIKTLLAIQLLLLLTSYALKAQVDVLNKATDLYNNEQYDSARFYIDKAVMHAETKEMAETWYIRSYTYFAIYTKREKGNKKSPSRLTTLESLRKLMILDKNKEFYDDNISLMQNLINTMHNDAADCLDPLEYETAIDLFRKSQDYFKLINPSQAALQSREIEFGLALGSVYNSIIETSKDSLNIVKYSDLAKAVYQKILSMEPNNISANYSLGIIYYNQAVNLIKASEYVDLSVIDKLQDESIRLFKASLPFMQTAEKLDPERIATLEGLSGIWFSLNDVAKYNHYQKKLQELKNKKQ